MAEVANHTPGPWNIRPSKDGSGDVGITADGLPNVLAECFAAIRHRDERAMNEALANARLISAAPDLLMAAKLLANLEHDDNGRSFPTASECAFARAAVAKASAS